MEKVRVARVPLLPKTETASNMEKVAKDPLLPKTETTSPETSCRPPQVVVVHSAKRKAEDGSTSSCSAGKKQRGLDCHASFAAAENKYFGINLTALDHAGARVIAIEARDAHLRVPQCDTCKMTQRHSVAGL